MTVLTLITVVGCGLNAGIFYAFSSFVMRALGRLPAAQGVTAMQRINIDVINPWFMFVFMGTPALCVGLIGWTLTDLTAPGAWLRIGGAVLHLAGCFGVTLVFNVPLNNRLAKAEPGTDEAQRLWAHYLRAWTAWNTVRTVLPTLAVVLLILSMLASA